MACNVVVVICSLAGIQTDAQRERSTQGIRADMYVLFFVCRTDGVDVVRYLCRIRRVSRPVGASVVPKLLDTVLTTGEV